MHDFYPILLHYNWASVKHFWNNPIPQILEHLQPCKAILGAYSRIVRSVLSEGLRWLWVLVFYIARSLPYGMEIGPFISQGTLSREYSACYMAQGSVIVTPRVHSQDAIAINPPVESHKLSDREWYHKMMLSQSQLSQSSSWSVSFCKRIEHKLWI